jgi:hypothetical protein
MILTELPEGPVTVAGDQAQVDRGNDWVTLRRVGMQDEAHLDAAALSPATNLPTSPSTRRGSMLYRPVALPTQERCDQQADGDR